MNKVWRSYMVVAVFGMLASPAWGVTAQWAVSAGFPGTANKVVTDAQGNVYVTGSTYSADTVAATSTADMLTVKYDSNGVKLWEVTYDGPEGGADAGAALVVDLTGNVYVAGSSYFINPQPHYGALCATVVKYSSAGEQLWVSRYPDSNHFSAASSIDVDASGDVYVALTSVYDYASGNAIDGITVKYWAIDGSRLWKYYMAYPGPLGYTDDFVGKLMVKDGFVYTSGTFGGGTHGYGLNYRNSLVWKFTLDGQLVHLNTFDGGGADYAHDFTVDGQGNVYLASMSDRLLTGTTMWDAYEFDYVTTKFDAAGQILWTSRYNDAGLGNHRPTSIAVDAVGSVYVTGDSDSDGDGTGKDLATVKYDADGALLWADRYNGTANGDETGGSVLIGQTGDVFVSGTSSNAGTGLDYTAVKYSEDGAHQWTALHGTNAEETAASAALGPNGALVVTGSSTDDAGGIPQFLTVSFVEVVIDIKPGTFPNTINPRAKGVVPVAVLSNASLDAASVVPASVRFGVIGTEAAARHYALADVNYDGQADLVLHFPVQLTGIVCGTKTGILTGSTTLGWAFNASDSIVTPGCK